MIKSPFYLSSYNLFKAICFFALTYMVSTVPSEKGKHMMSSQNYTFVPTGLQIYTLGARHHAQTHARCGFLQTNWEFFHNSMISPVHFIYIGRPPNLSASNSKHMGSRTPWPTFAASALAVGPGPGQTKQSSEQSYNFYFACKTVNVCVKCVVFWKNIYLLLVIDMTYTVRFMFCFFFISAPQPDLNISVFFLLNPRNHRSRDMRYSTCHQLDAHNISSKKTLYRN